MVPFRIKLKIKSTVFLNKMAFVPAAILVTSTPRYRISSSIPIFRLEAGKLRAGQLEPASRKEDRIR